MKTDHLIKSLAADFRPAGPSIQIRLLIALGTGALIVASLVVAGFGSRRDFTNLVVSDLRVTLKVVVPLVLLTSAAFLGSRALRPGQQAGWVAPAGLIAGLLLLSAAVFWELGSAPRTLWAARLFGDNALACFVSIVALSAPVLMLTLAAFRQGAPSNPLRAGALAGLIAGSLAATIYASHCTDDSPFFVAAWYGLAVLSSTALGALAGRRLLRW